MVAENEPYPVHQAYGLRASMRPRQIAAETPSRPSGPMRIGRFNEAAANGRGKLEPVVVGLHQRAASMRPRRTAAENEREPVGADLGVEASMRPRRIAAENLTKGRQAEAIPTASMRPRRIAAENGTKRPRPACKLSCFNEAAANRRGKRAPWMYPICDFFKLQ